MNGPDDPPGTRAFRPGNHYSVRAAEQERALQDVDSARFQGEYTGWGDGPLGFHHISEAGGIGLAVTGITIVFVALILVSLFIVGLPRLLPFVNSVLPVVEGHHAAPQLSSTPSVTARPEDEIVATIGFAFHMRRGE